MTREHKLALIVGFALVLVVGVLVSDHFSSARKSQPGSTMSVLGPRGSGAAEPSLRQAADNAAPRDLAMNGSSERRIGMPPTTPAAAPTYRDTDVLVPTSTQADAPSYQTGSVQPQNYPIREPYPGVNTGAPFDPQSPQIVSMAPTIPQGGAQNAPIGAPLVHTNHVPVEQPRNDIPPGFEVPASRPEIVIAPPETQPQIVEPTKPLLPVSKGKVQRRSVKEGETLYSLAQEFYGDGNLWSKLKEYNKGKVGANGSVREGVTLTFPPKDVLQGRASLGDGTTPAAAPASTTPRSTVPGPTIAGQVRPAAATSKTYTFQRGDVLSTVAQKTLGSARRWQELVDANPGVLDDPDNVAVGTVIKIPTSSAMR